MNKISLSIIVPFYNVERHICKCLDSLLDQNISKSSYEIICVNDCSKDNSVTLVNDYIKKNHNIRLVEHSINKKVGGARNTGLGAAKGEYVWFVDSDDYIKENCLKDLINKCLDNNLDVLAFNISMVNNDGLLLKDVIVFPLQTEILDGITFLKEKIGDNLIFNLGYPYRGIYNRNFLNQIQNFFPENISYGEETTYMARAILFSSRVLSEKGIYYYYKQHDNSITSKLFEKWKGELIFQSIFCAGNYTLNLIHEIDNLDKELKNNLLEKLPWFVNRLFIRLIRSSFKEQKIFFNVSSKNSDLINSLKPYMDFKNKILINSVFFQLIFIIILSPSYKLKHIKKYL